MDDLEDFLKGQEQPEAAVEPAAEPEPITEAEAPAPEEASGKPRDDKGRFAPKGETEAAPPAAEETIPVKALQEERRKRQELEARIAEYERIAQQPQQPPADIWEDTQGWQQQFGGSLLSEANRLSRINSSEMAARIKYDDFDDMFAKFNDMAQVNPALVQQTLDGTGTPSWLKAYEIAKNAARAEELSAVDVSDLEAKLEARIRAELEAKYAAPQPTPTPPVPETLAAAQSARGSAAGSLHVPTLDEILKR